MQILLITTKQQCKTHGYQDYLALESDIRPPFQILYRWEVCVEWFTTLCTPPTTTHMTWHEYYTATSVPQHAKDGLT